MTEVIPLFRPSVTGLEVRYVTEALRSGWWGMGPRVEEFEHRFAGYCGARHAVAVNSCTAALQLALEALGARYGEVIVPALTFVSTGLAALHARNKVVFADVGEDTLCLDWDDVRAKTTEATRAVIPVWYGGTIAHQGMMLGVPVIEDCAHACGSTGAGKLAQAACWSFQAVKNLACGDGGMVTTDDPALAARIRTLRWCGIDKSTWARERSGPGYGWEYDVSQPGHKMHMNDLTAALGLAQLERLDGMNKARRDLVQRYMHLMGGIRDWLRVPQWREDSAWHLFCVRVPAQMRPALIAHLLAAGVSAGVHYKPISHYPVFGARQYLPVTDRVWRELVTLPLFPDMTEAQQDRVIAAVRSFRPGP